MLGPCPGSRPIVSIPLGGFLLPVYRFIGPYPAFYEIIPGDVKPGDIHAFDVAPNDGQWVEADTADSGMPSTESAEPDALVAKSRKRSS